MRATALSAVLSMSLASPERVAHTCPVNVWILTGIRAMTPERAASRPALGVTEWMASNLMRENSATRKIERVQVAKH